METNPHQARGRSRYPGHAPATANIIAKLAHGIADDALTCIALALNPKAKVLVAPAMNGKMWLHPATQQNVTHLSRAALNSSGLKKACFHAAMKASDGFGLSRK